MGGLQMVTINEVCMIQGEDDSKVPRFENTHELFGKVGTMKWEDVVFPVKYLSLQELLEELTGEEIE